MRLPSRILGPAFMIINVVCWGAALPIVKPALELTTPFQHLFARYVIACFLTLPLLLYYLITKPKHHKSIPMILSLESIGTVVALGLVYEGLARTSALDAGIIITAAPIFLIFGGVIFLHEKEEKYEWIGLFISLIGTAFLLFPSASALATQRNFSFLIGNVLLVGQNVAEAAFFLLAKKRYKNIPKLFVTTLSFWLGLIGFGALGMIRLKLGPGAFLLDTWHDFQQPAVALAAFYMAIFGSIIGLTAYIAGQNMMEASEASLYRYLQPLIYVPLSIFFLHESFSWPTAIALVLIAAGVIVAQHKRKRTKKARLASQAGPSQLKRRTYSRSSSL